MKKEEITFDNISYTSPCLLRGARRVAVSLSNMLNFQVVEIDSLGVKKWGVVSLLVCGVEYQYRLVLLLR